MGVMSYRGSLQRFLRDDAKSVSIKSGRSFKSKALYIREFLFSEQINELAIIVKSQELSKSFC